jgi:hypothetical protein
MKYIYGKSEGPPEEIIATSISSSITSLSFHNYFLLLCNLQIETIVNIFFFIAHTLQSRMPHTYYNK